MHGFCKRSDLFHNAKPQRFHHRYPGRVHVLAMGKKAVFPGFSAFYPQGQAVIFQLIDLCLCQIRNAASQISKYTFIGKAAAFHIQNRPYSFRQRIGKYCTPAVHKTGNPCLFKGLSGLPSIGFEISGDHCNISISVFLFPNKTADPSADLLHLLCRIITGKCLYMLWLIRKYFPFKTKQLFF